ncbi:amidophosphoribosyltransferase [Methanorbis rubei]|uniref:Amidophosphoribosyltransferase n=1 Tax=Methanorbis rubei TaxID=3028300 RepID=A0AAE4SAZ0_9EURY|nr:Amidophosphoribosyltransferase [Methanocorpusculaceae archaeon Cs1]
MCGIAGIVANIEVSGSLYLALYALQHRGQESGGISTYDNGTVHKHKGYGLVFEVFSQETLQTLSGKTGLGHVRYPTTGGSKPENIQPFNFMFRGHTLSVVHNGNLVNTDELRYEYEGRGHIFSTTSDTEVISAILANEIIHGHTVGEAISFCMRTIRGSYAVIFMLDGSLYAFRDPLGIKPLCIGMLPDGGHVVASESVAFDAVGAKFLRDVVPGESLLLKADKVYPRQIMSAQSPAHCVFEYIYFARADSVIDGVSVYNVRQKTGALLAGEAPADADLVSPVPDSGIAAATGYADASGTPFREALIKNRYTGRTFIMPTQEKREMAVRMKLNPVRGHITGKSVVLVDDSIVRGTTSRRIIALVREFGAEKVHLRVASPPIIAPCYLGTDFPTREELISHHKNVEGVRAAINATSLAHISLEGLVEAIGLPCNHLCTGCLTGKYPLAIDGEEEEPRCIEKIDPYK